MLRSGRIFEPFRCSSASCLTPRTSARSQRWVVKLSYPGAFFATGRPHPRTLVRSRRWAAKSSNPSTFPAPGHQYIEPCSFLGAKWPHARTLMRSASFCDQILEPCRFTCSEWPTPLTLMPSQPWWSSPRTLGRSWRQAFTSSNPYAFWPLGG